jgi:hypothetical protein
MDIAFVNVQTPRDALQLAKEPEFRSHVTRHQWKQSKRREKRRRRRILLGGSNDEEDSEYLTRLVFDPFTSDQVSISPQIGGLRVDTFQSYTVSVQSWTQLLVDHCKVLLELCLSQARFANTLRLDTHGS